LDAWGDTANAIKSTADLATPSGFIKAVPSIAKSLWNNLPPVQLADSMKQILPMLDAYEKKRAGGASISDSIKATDDIAKQHVKNISALTPILDAFKANPTRETARMLTDAAAIAAATFLGGAAGEAAAPEADVAANAADATAGLPKGPPNPFRRMTMNPADRGALATQEPAQTALRTATADAGKATGTAPSTGGIRTLQSDNIPAIAKVERATYDALNKASGTDLKSLYDSREQLQDALDDPTNIANIDKLQEKLDNTNTNIRNGEAQAIHNKVSPKTLDNAKALTQKRYAMEDADKKIFNNNSLIKGNAANGTNETLNVDGAIKQLEDLDKPSKFAPRGSPTRLEQAYGKEGADKLKQSFYDAQTKGQKFMNSRSLRNTLLKYGVPGAAGAAGVAYEALK
jgi:hypothetical protein